MTLSHFIHDSIKGRCMKNKITQLKKIIKSRQKKIELFWVGFMVGTVSEYAYASKVTSGPCNFYNTYIGTDVAALVGGVVTGIIGINVMMSDQKTDAKKAALGVGFGATVCTQLDPIAKTLGFSSGFCGGTASNSIPIPTITSFNEIVNFIVSYVA